MKGPQFCANPEEKTRSNAKTIAAMTITDERATAKGPCVFGKFTLQMRPDKDKLTKNHASCQEQMRK